MLARELTPSNETANLKLLTVDKTKSGWYNIAKNVNCVISENNEQFDKILSLSYAHLPHHLKPCFLYMACFPEYYEMRASKLIKLWVAEGFLRPEHSRSLEEIAKDHLDDLEKRSLVLVNERKSNGKIKSFSIHDLLREMCIRKAREENFLLQLREPKHVGIKIPRRVSVIHSHLDFLESNTNGYNIRTIICLEDRRPGTRRSVRYFRLLRILDLTSAHEYFYKNDSSSTSLPEELFELFHLRYLAFDCTFSIPAAISNLRNLQTLIIGPRKYRGYFVPLAVEIWRMPEQLPAEIWNMPQLRHLIFCSGLQLFQKGAMSVLENLQTLSLAINFSCSPEIPGESTLRALPQTLKKLTLSGLKLPWKHMKIVGSLPNLQVLKLRDFACNGAEWESSEDGFCELRYLLISQSNLRHWMMESSHFPKLKCLVLLRCPNLSDVPEEIGEIPTLEVIEMDNWNRQLVESAKQMQSYQESCGNDGIQLRFV